MQGEVKIDQDNTNMETLPRDLDDDLDDFGDKMVYLFGDNSESNAQDTVNPDLGGEAVSQESTSIVPAACSAINEANENTNPCFSSRNRGEEAPTQRPSPTPYQQHPMFINSGPAQYNVPSGTNPNALMFYGPMPIPTIPPAPAPAQMSVIVNEVPYRNPFQHPTADQQPHYNIMNQGYALHDALRSMEALRRSMHLTPDQQTMWFNALLQNRQVRYQLPTQSMRFISGPSSRQGQNQQQQPSVPCVVRGQAPVGPMMHNQQDDKIVLDEAGPELDPELP